MYLDYNNQEQSQGYNNSLGQCYSTKHNLPISRSHTQKQQAVSGRTKCSVKEMYTVHPAQIRGYTNKPAAHGHRYKIEPFSLKQNKPHSLKQTQTKPMEQNETTKKEKKACHSGHMSYWTQQHPTLIQQHNPFDQGLNISFYISSPLDKLLILQPKKKKKNQAY